MQLNPDLVISGVVQILVLLLAISAHECAHAWSAWRLGDSTAADLGRVTLNPLRHLDPVGSLLLPALLAIGGGPVFGWAKPTPVRVSNLRRPARDHLLVTAAGPAANFLLAVLALAGLVIALSFTGEAGRSTATLSLLHDVAAAREGASFPLLFSLVQLAFLNGFLALFNLLPIPPLDGGQIVLHLLPEDWATKYSVIRPYGFMIVLGLALLNVMTVLVIPVYVLISFVINIAA